MMKKIVYAAIAFISSINQAQSSTDFTDCFEILSCNSTERNSHLNLSDNELDLLAEEMIVIFDIIDSVDPKDQKSFIGRASEIYNILRNNSYDDDELLMLAGDFICAVCTSDK
jgi:hypothetical protein